MVSHANLVAEIDYVNSMSTEDRLIHARQRRQEQLQRWKESELEYEKDKAGLPNGQIANDNKRSVKFGDSVTLLEAAARDDVDEVRNLLEGNTNPNEANDDGLTALHQACIDNFEDMVQLLIKYGANVNAVDSEQWTPLHAACTCGHTNIATILVSSGADLMALNADHNMPYDICEDEETLDFVEKAMASRGITQEQINTTRSSKERQIINDVQNIVDQGKSLDYKDECGATLLHIAAANGYVDLTRYLVLHNCKVNAQDADGWTPLHAAACWNQLDVVELLGAQGGDPTVKNTLGEIPADVTDDDEIKALLNKIKSTMKDRKPKKIFHGWRGFSSRNNSRRASGMRGQSFKGRSKRDKKSGISTIEAKSEAQFWSGNQEQGDIKSASPSTPTDNNNHIQKKEFENLDHVTHNGLKNGSKTDSKDFKNDSTARKINSEANSTKSDSGKKDKKQKKSKKAESEPANSDNKAHDTSEANGKSGIRNVIGLKSRYSLTDFDDTKSPNEGKNNAPGKTLAELKRERAQEKSNKNSPSTPDGMPYPTATSNFTYNEPSEDIKQFKGQTARQLSEGSSNKRKLCIIL
ncbi:protein phosphatase 1 regulatory subunit 16A-like [Styela clava]